MTVEGDQPRVRLFGTCDVFGGRLYIQTGRIKPVAHRLKANQKVEICAMSADGRWSRIAAEAVLDDNVAVQVSIPAGTVQAW